MPVHVRGERAENLFAFVRRQEQRTALVVVTRFAMAMGSDWPVGEAWRNTEVEVAGGGEMEDLLNAGRKKIEGWVRVEELLTSAPVGVWMKND